MKKVITTVLIVLLSLISSFAQEISYRFEQISMDKGLSNNRVYSIIQDHHGFLWIGTLDGLNRYDGYEFKVFKSELDNEQSLSNNRVVMLKEDSRGYIWVVGKSTGINRFDPKTNTFKRYNRSKESDTINPENQIHRIYEVDENFYIVSDNFTYQYNYQEELFVKVEPISEKPGRIATYDIIPILENHFNKQVDILCSYLDKQGNTWLGITDIGLVRINSDESITHFKDIGGEKNSVNSILEDNSGIIWIGTWTEGLYKYTPSSEKFSHYQQFKDENSLIDKISVRSITKDSENNIWIGTASNGVIKFNTFNKAFKHYQHNPEDTNTLPHNKIRSLYADSKGNVWIGSYRGLSKYNFSTDGFQNFYFFNRSNPEVSHIDFRVYNIDEDESGNLWIANWGNLIKFSVIDNTYKVFSKDLFKLDNIRSVFIGSNNKLWISAEFGGINCLDIQTETIDTSTSYINDLLPDQNVFDIYEDSKGLLWFATFNGLCSINRETKEVDLYTSLNGMPSNMSYGILEDDLGNIWVTTSNGLAKIDSTDHKILIFTGEHGLQSSEFLEGAFYSTKDKSEFILGGSNGFNVFNPDDIYQDTTKPEIVFTSLMVMNKKVLLNQKVNKKIILKNTIEYTNSLNFNRLDKIISFEFAAIHFKLPQENQYAYKLEGFDEDWNKADADRRFASYTNLDPGNYIFRVKAANCDKIWNEEGKSISIHIKAPFWRTYWFYILVFGIVAYGVYFFIKEREKQSKEITKILEQKVKEGEAVINQKIEEVNKQKAEIEKRDIEERDIRYFNKGLAKFGEIIGENNDDISKLCKKIISELIDYIKVEQVNIYIKENDNQGVEVLANKGVVSDEDKKQYLIGEGIPGACYKENKTIIIDNMPEEKRLLASGLGQSSLSYLIAIPISMNDLKAGVLEIAAFNEVEDYKLKLLYKLSENLTSTIEYIKSNMEVAKLLKDSKLNSENLAAQDEELRQNLEELSSIQENSAIEKEELINEKEEIEAKYNELVTEYDNLFIAKQALQKVTEHLQVPLYIKDLKNNIIACNESFAQRVGFNAFADVPKKINEELSKRLKSLGVKKRVKLTNQKGQEIGEIIFL